MTALDVLTDIPGRPGRFWGEHTTFVGPACPPRWLIRLAGERWAYNLKGALAAMRLFARRQRCRGVVTDGGSSGVLLAYLQAICPWGRKPHVMIDCLWDMRADTLRTWLKRLRLRLAARSVHRFVVWASHEVEDYARAFGLPREKLAYVPFHTTVHDYEYEITRRRLPVRGRQFGPRLSAAGRGGTAARPAGVDRQHACQLVPRTSTCRRTSASNRRRRPGFGRPWPAPDSS